MTAFFSIILRDCRLSWRQGASSGMSVAFFIIVVSLFPLGIGPEANILSRVSVGVIWVAALLACLLSLDRLFQADYEDGSLDQLVLSVMPLEMTVLAKSIAHWMTTALPLIVIAPLLSVFMNMPAEGMWPLLSAMLIGTPGLSFIGSIGAGLTLSLRRGGVLLSLLVLPLYIPFLIFGVMAVDAAIGGFEPAPHLMILGAFTLTSMVLAPWAAAAALRLGLE
ncbi:MAG: heme exporter protein CcmB [Kordiimonas sp.]|nr:heme exporter protein CcmB [Kordiimonas sp.]|tara:strand:- start:363 stop:1028 length:666 start_codon:yes stop_codon:yes gene_type:complete